MVPDLRIIPSLDGQTVTASAICVCCAKPAVVRDIPAQAFALWFTGGVAIQDALPMVPENDREILISGTHDACWHELMKEVD